MKVKGQLRNDKGNIVPKARKFFKNYFLENKEDLIGKFTEVNGNLELPLENEVGDIVYVRLAVTISDKSLDENISVASTSTDDEVYSFTCGDEPTEDVE